MEAPFVHPDMRPQRYGCVVCAIISAGNPGTVLSVPLFGAWEVNLQ